MLKIITSPFVPILAFAMLSTACNQSVEQRAGLGLLSQFSNSCVTKGHWTELAINQNQALKAVLEDLKGKDECKPYLTQLTTIQGLSDSISKTMDENTAYAGYQKRLSELTDLIPISHQLMPAGGLSADAQTQLLQSAFEKEVEIKKLKSDYDVKSGDLRANLFKQQSADFVKNIQGMMSNMTGLQNCFLQSPLAAGQLAIQMMALSGNTAASSSKGAAINVISQLLTMALSFDNPTARIERAKFAVDQATLSKGLICAMESMTELYCDAQDAQDLIQFQADSIKKNVDDKNQMATPIWRGMFLLTKRLPLIARQLLVLRNGSDPNDNNDSNRQNDVWDNLVTLQKTRTSAMGILNNLEGNYNSTQDEDARKGFIIQSLTGLTEVMMTSPPFLQNVANSPARLTCMLTIDPSPEGKKCPEIKPQIHLDTYIRDNSLYRISFAGIRSNFEVLFMRASRAVNIDLARKLVIDPQQAVVSLREPETANVSFYEALSEFDEFLDGLEKTLRDHADGAKTSPGRKLDWDPLLAGEVKDTKRRIREVLSALDPNTEALADLNLHTEKFQAVIGQVFTSFNLRLNTQFLPQRMKKLVEWDLNRRIRNGELPRDSAEILVNLGVELTDSLGANASGLDPASLDVASAKSITQSNLQAFLRYFSGSGTFSNTFEDAASFLLDQADRAGEPRTGRGSRDNRQLLAELCILAASSYDSTNPLDVKSDVPMVGAAAPGELISACRGAVLQSVYLDRSKTDETVGGLPLALHFDKLFGLYSGQASLYKAVDNAQAQFYNAAAGTRVVKALNDTWVGRILRPVLRRKSSQSDPTDTYSEIFSKTVFNKSAKDEEKFERKVCTFHRFLRASRIREALPALNGQFRQALFEHK